MSQNSEFVPAPAVPFAGIAVSLIPAAVIIAVAVVLHWGR